jgi:hypothetical protein
MPLYHGVYQKYDAQVLVYQKILGVQWVDVLRVTLIGHKYFKVFWNVTLVTVDC